MVGRNITAVLFSGVAWLGMLTNAPRAAAGESQVRADIEALYAKRDESFMAKDNTFEKSLWAEDYTSKNKEGKISTRQEAETESDGAVAMMKEVQKIQTKVEELKEGPNGEVTVMISAAGSITLTVEGQDHKVAGQSKSRDIWVKTSQGWRIKSHEVLESSRTVDGQKYG